MGTFSIWHWMIVLLALSTIIPVVRTLKRTGLNPWWAILALVPIVAWLALWMFAYARWPNVESSDQPKATDA